VARSIDGGAQHRLYSWASSSAGTSATQPAIAVKAHARHDRCRAQREHHRDRVNPALIVATVGDLSESLQQLRVHHRGRRKIVSSDPTRPRRTERSETRLSDGRMQQPRNPDGEKFVRGLLVLPGLRRLSSATRRRSPSWCVSARCKHPRRSQRPGTRNFDLETAVVTGLLAMSADCGQGAPRLVSFMPGEAAAARFRR
jgi:hypothetical protein